MSARCRHVSWAGLIVATLALVITGCAPAAGPAAPAASAPSAPALSATPVGQGPGAAPAPTAGPPEPFAVAKTLSLEELHARALAEGGVLSFYSTLAQVSAQRILPVFEQRFPGMKVEQVDATADKLTARVVAEARGGKVLGDVFQAPVDYVQQVNRQGLLLQDLPAEALAYPEDLRGPYWVATALQFIVPAWNTNLVRPEEAPRQFEDLADPRWRNRLIAEPRDTELLMGLALRKYRNDEVAVDLLRRIAANNPEFHPGHSDLAELLAAGQAAACLTCFADQMPPRIQRGAPLDFMLTEGIGLITASAIFKDAPHPYTAMLWQRWVLSEEGQRAYADGGRTPAHPGVEQRTRTRPERVYALGADEVANMDKYQRLWKEIFQLR